MRVFISSTSDTSAVYQTKIAQVQGEYKETGIDSLKKDVDFCLIEVGKKNTIRWKDGSTERISDSRLQKLQSSYNWTTDF